MARIGHDSERAALIYQHEARGADKAITDAIDKHVDDEQRQDDEDDGGPAGALVPAQWHDGLFGPRYDERPGFGNSFRPGLLYGSG